MEKLADRKDLYNFNLISKNRAVIFGLSILWIMLYHSTLIIDEPWLYPLKLFKKMGDGGVDIFLLISGVSLYHSFSKNRSKKQFYIRRLRRTVPPTLLVMMPWFLRYNIVQKGNVFTYLLDVTGLSLFVNGNRGMWYVTAIMLFYLVYPYIFALFDRRGWKRDGLLLALAASLALNAALSFILGARLWDFSELLWRRAPVFIIGAYLGKAVSEGKTLKLSRRAAALISAAVLIACVAVSALARQEMIIYRYFLAIPALASVVLASVIGESKKLYKLCAVFAPITLELYLTHEKVLYILSRPLKTVATDSAVALLVNLAAFVGAYVAARVLAAVVRLLMNTLHKQRERIQSRQK